MLDEKEAIKIGINACIDKIGRHFVLSHKDEAVISYGKSDNDVVCFVGVGKVQNNQNKDIYLVLDSTSKFEYYAHCKVSLLYGTKVFTDLALPMPNDQN